MAAGKHPHRTQEHPLHAHTARVARWFTAALTLLLIAACADELPVSPGDAASFARGRSGKPAKVDDLAIVSTTSSSITLAWTQVDDGTGAPADYEVHRRTDGGWGNSEAVDTGSCAAPVEGSEIGDRETCTVEGLSPESAHEFRVLPYRDDGRHTTYGSFSNVASGETDAEEESDEELQEEEPSDEEDTVGEEEDGSDDESSDSEEDTSEEEEDTSEEEDDTSEDEGDSSGGEDDSSDDTEEEEEPSRPEDVTDLEASSPTTSSIDLSFTEVDDGTGEPADYRVRYARTSINPAWPDDYTMVEDGDCANPVEGTAVGATFTCTVTGLESGTEYVFGVISYRVDDSGSRVFASSESNKPTEETEEEITAEEPAQAAAEGIWVDRDALTALPTSGDAWERVLKDAERDPGRANIADQDSNHDVYTLAAALACARVGEHCSKARHGVVDAIGTEDGGRWLAVGRNLGAYVIAADLLNLRGDGDPSSDGTRVEQWMEGWLTKELADNVTGEPRRFGPFHSGANAAAQEGFAYAAVAAYLDDDRALDRAWDAFRTYACDPAAPDREDIYLDKVVADGWAHDDDNPCAVNPAGTEKEVPSGYDGAGGVYRIDGAITGDMRRGGEYEWEPGYTQYPWVGLEGFVPAALILHRAGYPAFEVADQAVLRTHDYLWFLRQETGEELWFDGVRAREAIQLVNVFYGTSFPVNRVTGGGRTFGYTDWTHPH